MSSINTKLLRPNGLGEEYDEATRKPTLLRESVGPLLKTEEDDINMLGTEKWPPL